MNSYTQKELDAWAKYEIGKPCLKHPDRIMKKGKYGPWCGGKDELGNWCDGGWPTDEFIINLRKENYDRK